MKACSFTACGLGLKFRKRRLSQSRSQGPIGSSGPPKKRWERENEVVLEYTLRRYASVEVALRMRYAMSIFLLLSGELLKNVIKLPVK